MASRTINPEGWLFPDTYLFDRGTSDVEILSRAHRRMREVLDEEWAKREQGLPLETPYQALTLASIVEKETGLASERPQIAGVFVRRLQKGMKLQTDPTVIYGMGEDFDGNIRRDDLTRPTPYNTYVIQGTCCHRRRSRCRDERRSTRCCIRRTAMPSTSSPVATAVITSRQRWTSTTAPCATIS